VHPSLTWWIAWLSMSWNTHESPAAIGIRSTSALDESVYFDPLKFTATMSYRSMSLCIGSFVFIQLLAFWGLVLLKRYIVPLALVPRIGKSPGGLVLAGGWILAALLGLVVIQHLHPPP
jgi:hypothetical protein